MSPPGQAAQDPAAGIEGASIHILLIEDDPGDVAYTLDVLAEHKVRNRLTVIADGLQAISYLLRREPYDDAPRPDVVLLDLNLPGVDGRVVLDVMRSQDSLASIPVAVLTSSPVDQRILQGLALPADMYLQKPLEFDRLVQLVRHFEGLYWRVDRQLSR